MSFILKENNQEILRTTNWSPKLYSKKTKTSFPKTVENTYTWTNDNFWLGWEDDIAIEPQALSNEELANQINERNKFNRKLAYIEESDPLFFKYQRGEIEKQEWLDKVSEIKARIEVLEGVA